MTGTSAHEEVDDPLGFRRMVHSPVQRTGIGQGPTGRQLGHGRRSQPEGRFAEQLTARKVKFSFAKWIGIHVSN